MLLDENGVAWIDDTNVKVIEGREQRGHQLRRTTGTPSYAVSNSTSPDVLVPRRLC
jgi:hypothetical protein